MAGLSAVVVPAAKRHTATVIFAHGLGDSGAGWSSLAENWRSRGKFENVAFVFPNAPRMKVTVNLGMSMPSWYDIESLQNLEQDQDVEGILKSRDQIHKLVDLETKDKGIPSSRIVLGGFSQGGALALISGITYPSKLGGIFSLSGYLPIHDKAKELSKIEGPNSSLPIFMAHGTADPTVSHNWGITSKEALKSIGWTVNFRSYDGMGHTAVPEEIDDLEKYLAERLPPLDASVDE